ncbi:MAG: dihydroorotase [Zetaproteobacteria bacterium]|nr:MAG: dihydroorotase [Zetaproteobacteria bacterium]
MIEFTLPKWYDLHTHFRQGDVVAPYIQAHLDMGCIGALAMPNTKPPTAVVFDADEGGEYWSIERYMRDLRRAGGDQFSELIVPLYLTKDTTPEMIRKGAHGHVLKACKSYPPHGTTGAEFGIPVTEFIENGVFAAMEEAGIVLCIHGEEHGLPPEKYFDRAGNAEEIFYTERMPRVRDKFPNLKIVCEHVTTKLAVDFVCESGDTVVATVTPQHLIYTIGDLIQGLKYHLFCLPVLKHCADRDALRKAVSDPKNTKFFAGTDSAPHTTKATDCGCAAGCFTGGIAPQLYAQAFEMAGVDLSRAQGQDIFKNFLCLNGAAFYGLPISQETFTLVKEDAPVEMLKTSDGDVTPLPLGLGQKNLPWSIRR